MQEHIHIYRLTDRRRDTHMGRWADIQIHRYTNRHTYTDNDAIKSAIMWQLGWAWQTRGQPSGCAISDLYALMPYSILRMRICICLSLWLYIRPCVCLPVSVCLSVNVIILLEFCREYISSTKLIIKQPLSNHYTYLTKS